MDNLIVFVPFLLGLTLFSVLYAAERLSARRYRRKVEPRLGRLTGDYRLNSGTAARLIEQAELIQRSYLTVLDRAEAIRQLHPMVRPHYSLTYPNIPKPYQRKVT